MPKLSKLIGGIAQGGMRFGKILEGSAKRNLKNYIVPAPQRSPLMPGKLPMPKVTPMPRIIKK